MGKAIFIQGPAGSGKSTAIGQVLDPVWELRIAKYISDSSSEEVTRLLMKAVDDERKFIHLEAEGHSFEGDLLHAIDTALEKGIVIFITGQNSPNTAMKQRVVWLKAEPFPYQ